MKLKTNCFSDAILGDLDTLYFETIKINVLDNKNVLKFKWTWHEFDGTGEIEFTDKGLCNEFGDDYSHLSLSTECRKKHQDIKPTCSLYNDKDLESIFNYILDKMKVKTIK